MCINLIKPDIAASMVIMMVGVYYQTGQIRQFLYNCMYISCTNACIQQQCLCFSDDQIHQRNAEFINRIYSICYQLNCKTVNFPNIHVIHFYFLLLL